MRTILVTGATDGLGRHLAARLAASGDRVIVHGRDPERVRRVRAEIGGTTDGLLADLADLRQVDRMATEVEERFDRLDVLVNNAGVGGGAPHSGPQLGAGGRRRHPPPDRREGPQWHLPRRGE
ncbi:SDR family NAD(P)-dependent oxidoreductase [Microbispora siamensis]|uniref:Short chain dehydrogenase n=1 Tax=Microbispora siamensis TaxID=564413 RepID=A0ABQ4GKV8_9ACTN|nr:SDR family NAD(P)-dependent oxidoreductase [Microbispora siamensis]GIH62060.1 hypothetical protein Msi02_28770 [Microbispora siamensis]